MRPILRGVEEVDFSGFHSCHNRICYAIADMAKNMAKSIILPKTDWFEMAGKSQPCTRGSHLLRGTPADGAAGAAAQSAALCRKRAGQLSGAAHRNAPPHQHHRHVLICALRGAGRVWVDSGELFAGRAPGDPHLSAPEA